MAIVFNGEPQQNNVRSGGSESVRDRAHACAGVPSCLSWYVVDIYGKCTPPNTVSLKVMSGIIMGVDGGILGTQGICRAQVV